MWTGERFGINHIADVLLGKNTKKVKDMGHEFVCVGIEKEFGKEESAFYFAMSRGLLEK
jgi:ATP-dependent DNA helicase RecQ